MSNPASKTIFNLVSEKELISSYEKGWQDCKKAVIKIIRIQESENFDPFTPSPFETCIKIIEKV